jgi:hypothetical protein
MVHTSSGFAVDRALTPEEHLVVQWLLQHGDGDNSVFLAQLNSARVSSLCSCGCASIDFSIDGLRHKDPGMRVLADYQWQNNEGHLYGAFVFEQGGLLAGLDLWSIDGQSTPLTVPSPERLVPYGTRKV